MLIAGSRKAPAPAEGFVRVNGIAFNPEVTDRQVYVLAPPNWHGPTIDAFNQVAGEGAKLDIEAVNGRIYGKPTKDDVFLRWGYAGQFDCPGPKLNFGGGISRSSNQTECLRALGDLAPLTWDNFEEAALYARENKPFGCIGKRNRGMHGRGKAVLTAPPKLRYDIYQQYIPRRTEWRVTVFKQHIISAMRKEPLNQDLTKFRDGFDYKRVQIIPKAVANMAIEAAKRVGLDFTGVDLMRDEDTGRFYVIETNSAPGMSPPTIKRLYMHIQREYAKR